MYVQYIRYGTQYRPPPSTISFSPIWQHDQQQQFMNPEWTHTPTHTTAHTKIIKTGEKVTATMVRAAAAGWTTICPPLAADSLSVPTAAGWDSPTCCVQKQKIEWERFTWSILINSRVCETVVCAKPWYGFFEIPWKKYLFCQPISMGVTFKSNFCHCNPHNFCHRSSTTVLFFSLHHSFSNK